MRSRLLCIIPILLYGQHSFAQHADLGTGVLKNDIWWLNWAGFAIQEGASKTFVTNDGLTIQVTLSHVSAHVPYPAPMNDYFGAVLHLLYDFSDPSILPALYDNPSQLTYSFTMTMAASRQAVPVSFSFITADAEASQMTELTTLHTNGSNWQTIQFFRNSSQTDDPLTGCGTQTAQIKNTFAGLSQVGQNPVIATLSPPPSSGPLIVDVTCDHGGTTGGMALAFGILQSEDRGDLPSSYGAAQHQLLYTVSNACNFLPPYPSLDQSTTLMIGSVPGDADPIQYADDNAIGVDEEGVNTFPEYDGSGSYSVNVVVNNTTGADAYLTGWFDYNRNGIFETGESVTAVIPNNATSMILTWTGLPAYLPQGTSTGYGFRFRLSSDQAATQAPAGFAIDGEVEDYFVTSALLCTPLHASVTPNTSGCAGQPVPLHASGGLSYAWSPVAGLSDAASADPVADIRTSTTYTVTASNPQGCMSDASVTLTVLLQPSTTVSNDTTVCQDYPVNLTASGGYEYTWTSSDHLTNASGSAITASPDHSTRYYVLVTDNNGCTATDSVDVTVHPVPVFAAGSGDPVICKFDSIVLSASGGDQYNWTSDTGLPLGSGPSIRVSPPDDNTYQVQITDHICRLTKKFDLPVMVRPLPVLDITKSNDLTCTLGQAILHATGGISWQWDNIPGISALTSSDPIVTPAQTTTYYVRGTDKNGCSSIDSITVSVDLTSDLSHYPVPSAFTPNNDGNNDCFGLKYWGRVTNLEWSVYNRWGQRVFYTTDPLACWDGTFKGTPQPAGGYAYQIKAATVCGMAYRTGIVILVR